jgi:hypothetical protein
LAYIGTIPAEAYTSFAVQHFTTSATDTFTLDFPVANENEIALFINNVRQEPGSGYAYTASGTTLTLASAITGSDSMYCVFIGKTVQTVAPAAGSVTNDMLAGSIANAKLANSSITLNGTPVSLGGSATVANTPAFRARRTSNQTLTDATNTKIQFNTEDFDTDSCYDNATNYRFTPTVAGKYLIGTQIRMLSDGNTLLATTNVSFFKNGGEVVSSPTNFRNNQINGQTYFLSDIMTFNGSSDYVEVYVNADVDSGGIIAAGGSACHFFGYKLIGA